MSASSGAIFSPRTASRCSFRKKPPAPMRCRWKCCDSRRQPPMDSRGALSNAAIIPFLRNPQSQPRSGAGAAASDRSRIGICHFHLTAQALGLRGHSPTRRFRRAHSRRHLLPHQLGGRIDQTEQREDREHEHQNHHLQPNRRHKSSR